MVSMRAALFGFPVVLAGLGGGWFYGQSRLTQVEQALLAREAALGRQWICENEQQSGLPLGVARKCTGLALTSVPLQLRVAQLVGGWWAWHPDSALVTLTSPAQFVTPNSTLVAQWRAATLAYGGAVSHSASFALDLADGSFDFSGGASSGKARLDRLKVSIIPGVPGNDTTLPFSFDLDGLRREGADAFFKADESLTLHLSGQGEHIDQLQRGQPPAQVLEAWRSRGGRLVVSQLVLNQGALALNGSGVFRLDEAHRLSGTFDGTLRNVTSWMEQHNLSPKTNMAAAMAGGVLKSMQDPQDPTVTRLHVTIENGRLSLGTFALPVALPPVY